MDFEKIAREKIKCGLISVETLAEWFKDIYWEAYNKGSVDMQVHLKEHQGTETVGGYERGWSEGYDEACKDFHNR